MRISWNGLSIKISSSFAIDIDWLYKYRAFDDGLSIVELNVEASWQGDHSPSFRIEAVMLNFMILGFAWYNVWHVGERGKCRGKSAGSAAELPPAPHTDPTLPI